MSPRPRTVDDAAIILAAIRIIERVGPAKLTLAQVAREVGLAPATLVQRFGSKRRLLITLAKSGLGESEAFVTRLREEGRSPLTIAREFLLCFARMVSSPREMAHHLAFFQMDLTEPALYRILLEMSKTNERLLTELLREALVRRELGPSDPKALGRALLALTTGSLLSWAIFRTGTAPAWLGRDLDTVLRPYLPR